MMCTSHTVSVLQLLLYLSAVWHLLHLFQVPSATTSVLLVQQPFGPNLLPDSAIMAAGQHACLYDAIHDTIHHTQCHGGRALGDCVLHVVHQS